MIIRKLTIFLSGAVFGVLFSASQAEELIYSGFMTDYTQLQKVTDGSADYRYIAPGAEDRLTKYFAVMIDQPEIFIANDSPYRGVKPKQLDALAEALRAGIASGLSEDLFVVDRPGENVLYLSVAITNLKLKKRKKKVFNYLPVGLVIGGIKGAATTDIAKKADLKGLVFELEVFDSVTEERLVAIIDSLGDDEEIPTTWGELEEFMVMYGRLMQCRFDNAKLPEEQRINCLARD